MTVYVLTIKVWNYQRWYDGNQYDTEYKVFSTEEKAKDWIKNNSKYAHTAHGDIAEHTYQLPAFKIKKTEVE